MANEPHDSHSNENENGSGDNGLPKIMPNEYEPDPGSMPIPMDMDGLDAEDKINNSNLVDHDHRSSINFDDTDHLLSNAKHIKQDTVIIKPDIDLYGVALNPEFEDEGGFVMVKDGCDICRSVYLSLMLTIGIVLGIFGIIMSISVIYGWYKG
mmetsp:Transcript_48111/g.43143  ORF Transcript_48111/g.43143 Transcript_48111/m.43143 type:complete len:153 (+) Transcript_48111:1-459(+)